MKRRSGAALLELLTAMTLLGLLAAASGILIHSQSTLVRTISERAAADETMRTARLIVRAEFQDLAAADVRAITTDSLAARVYRGAGIVCAVDSTRVLLRYRGMRRPEPDKDSLLVLGEERAVAFADAVLPGNVCAALPGEDLIALRAQQRLRLNAVVLVFESGAYHVATRALRYRRGLEGRQPVTDELLDDRASGFAAEAGQRGVVVRLRSRPRLVAPRRLESRVGFRNRSP